MKKKIGVILLGLSLLTLSSCISRAPTNPVYTEAGAPAVVGHTNGHPQGVVPSVWAEPMVDVVDVPPGLDPDGAYYRPAHKEVLEVRQGRWEYQPGTEPAK